ncbi:metallophosphoesterase family protein [Candidatus Latescibacterota bacterium]
MRHPFNKFFQVLFFLMVILVFCLINVDQQRVSADDSVFSFIVTCDMREFAGPKYQTSRYFLGTCEAIRDAGKGDFMISPGDVDPPEDVFAVIKKVLGAEYLWYPAVGNHEAETLEDMEWLREWGSRDIPNLVRRGPENGEETNYSFDYGSAHFVVINQYYDGTYDYYRDNFIYSDTGTNGDVCDALFDWLKEDLEANDKSIVFVIGHEPFISIPDVDRGRIRHLGDSLNEHLKNSHRFQCLLRKHNITAYICGHTHNCSYSKINDLWQLDAGHCRGIGDKNTPSTFLKINVSGNSCSVDIYRDDSNGGQYTRTCTVVLD